MEPDYQKVINYMLEAGQRIKEKAGKIEDIGVKKQWLTEEDIAIERDLTKIIKTFENDHLVYAEEENDNFETADNVWAIDPISSTSSFIGGLPHYSIVCSHLHKGQVTFAAVYDPTINELYTAYLGKGAFLNGEKIQIQSRGKQRFILNLSYEWAGKKQAKDVWISLFDQNLYRYSNSFAVSYCWIAAGRYDGIVALTKDTFPEFAGKLIIEEAGGIFRNLQDEENINHFDRVFIGGSQETYQKLSNIIKPIMETTDER
jgi:myo-inositol-1(or 4)-monophosphatase